MYCLYGNSSWYIDCRPLYGRCPLLEVSVIGGSTVYRKVGIRAWKMVERERRATTRAVEEVGVGAAGDDTSGRGENVEVLGGEVIEEDHEEEVEPVTVGQLEA